MSDSYDLGCLKCKKSINIGQGAGDSPFCFYSGEPEVMNDLKNFLWEHFSHHLSFEFSDVIQDRFDGLQVEDDS